MVEENEKIEGVGGVEMTGADIVAEENEKLNDADGGEMTGADIVTEKNEKINDAGVDYAEVREEFEEDAEILSDLTTGVNYEQAKEKYQENLSTGITFLLFGIAGIVVVILNIVGVLHFFSIKNASGILMTVVMGAMFIIFSAIGVMSFIAAGKDKKNAKFETDNSSMIMTWLDENVTADEIDASFDSEELSDEMKYFGRSDYLKDRVSAQFEGLDEKFIEDIVEQYIEKTFQIE